MKKLRYNLLDYSYNLLGLIAMNNYIIHVERKSTKVWKTKIGIKRGNPHQKDEEISGRKTHTNTLKLN